MIIDKPKQKPKHRNMQLKEADIDQLAVFDELIAESFEEIRKEKLISRYKRNENGKAIKADNEDNIFLIEHLHIKLKFKKNVANYNKYRKAKKAFVKSLERK